MPMAGGAGPTGNISKKQKTGTKLSESNLPIFPEVLDGLNKYLLNLETTSTNERSSMKNPDSPEDEKTGKVRFFKFRMSSKIAKLAEELHRPSFRVLLENSRRTFSAQLDDNYSVSNLRQTLLNNIEPGPPPDCQDQNVSDSAFSEIYAEISNSMQSGWMEVSATILDDVANLTGSDNISANYGSIKRRSSISPEKNQHNTGTTKSESPETTKKLP
eukprot:686316_1